MTSQAPESQPASDFPVSYSTAGVSPEKASLLIVWAHGWGHDHRVFLPFVQSLSGRACHLLIDFPGFGNTPKPPDNWTTADYADATAKLLRARRNVKKIIWVGHSFGARVGLQMAARHPELVDGLFLFAAAGLQRRMGILKRLFYWGRIFSFKTMRKFAEATGQDVEALRRKHGSDDYRNAGALRPLFLRIVREDLSEQAKTVRCPVYLLYGLNDTATPPEMGQRFARLIPNAELGFLPGQDHLSVLREEGRHHVIRRLADFIEKLK
jgi:pimeloyl-ACP methyl ester carboxylesterase